MERVNKMILVICLAFVLAAVTIVIKMSYIVIAHGREMSKAVIEDVQGERSREGIGGNVYADDGVTMLAYSSPEYDVRWDAETAHRYVDSVIIKPALKKKTESRGFTKRMRRVNAENAELLSIKREHKKDSLLSIYNPTNLARHLDKRYLNNKYPFKRAGQSYKSILVDGYNNNRRYVKIADNVSFQELDVMRSFPFFDKPKYNGGLITEKKFGMIRTTGPVGAITVGYHRTAEETGADKDKDKGIVGAYNEELRGETVTYSTIKFRGYLRPADLNADYIPMRGRDVVTTINADINEFAYIALMKQMQISEAKGGCVIVLEVATGDVKAMINLRQDSAHPARYYDDLNIAISHMHHPGSVFKLSSLMAALADDKITLDSKVNVKDPVTLFGMNIRDDHKFDKDIMTVKEVLAHSSNVGTSKLIYECYKNNPQQFIDGLHKFHLDEKLGLELQGEGKPDLNYLTKVDSITNRRTWWKGSLHKMSYGYEVLLAPIHIAAFYNAVANDGVYLKPRFVKEILGNKKQPAVEMPIVVIDTICTPRVAAMAREMLREVVVSGTAKTAFKDAPYSFAGKTGTSQVRASADAHNASFVGYFPAENPIYTIYVLVIEPRHGYFASTVAAPVVREVADKIAGTDPRLFNTKTIMINE